MCGATLKFNYPDEEVSSMVDDLSTPSVKPPGADAMRDLVGGSKARRQRLLPGKRANVELFLASSIAHVVTQGLVDTSLPDHFAVSTGGAGAEQRLNDEYTSQHAPIQQNRT